jgi:hypothetical protein
MDDVAFSSCTLLCDNAVVIPALISFLVLAVVVIVSSALRDKTGSGGWDG